MRAGISQFTMFAYHSLYHLVCVPDMKNDPHIFLLSITIKNVVCNQVTNSFGKLHITSFGVNEMNKKRA